MTNKARYEGTGTRILGRKIGRELSEAELESVAGAGTGSTGPNTYGTNDTDYS
ncbi:MAG TPA: hypothetical protein VGC56_12105 [Allosphingosinicella sp.]|jgi:hypothetical protein